MSAPRSFFNSLLSSSQTSSSRFFTSSRCSLPPFQYEHTTTGNLRRAVGQMSARNGYGTGGQIRHKRQFSQTASRKNPEREPFHRRLRKALRETKIKWYPIPAVLGIGFLGLGQLYRVNEREKKARRDEEAEALLRYSNGNDASVGTDSQGRKFKRKRIRPSGPW